MADAMPLESVPYGETMPATDPLGNRCDRMIQIHVRQVPSVSLDVLGAVRMAQHLYGPHGLYLKVASLQTLSMTPGEAAFFETLETGCSIGAANSKRSTFYARYGVQDLVSICVFVIKELRAPVPAVMLGCAAHEPNEPAVFLASRAQPDTLAHEIGHVLLETQYEHSLVATNIMSDGEYDVATIAAPKFTPSQVARMRRSPYALPC